MKFATSFEGDKFLRMHKLIDGKKLWDWSSIAFGGGLSIAAEIAYLVGAAAAGPLGWAALAVSVIGIGGSFLFKSRDKKEFEARTRLEKKFRENVAQICDTLETQMNKNLDSLVSVRKDKTKPKERYSQTLWWTRHEWAGRGETREVTDFVSIPRERYARIEFEPYSVELFLKYDGQGQLIVMTDLISYCQDNEKLLINTINIFLTNFEECEVLTENFENVMPTRIIRLNWEVLPSGDYPWERMQDDLKKVSEKSSKTAKKVLIDKCEFINSFQPDFRAYGKSGFQGYVIFGFTDRDICFGKCLSKQCYIRFWQELGRTLKTHYVRDLKWKSARCANNS